MAEDFDIFPVMASLVLLLALGLQFVLLSASSPLTPSAVAARRPRLVTIPPLPDYPSILASPVFAPDRKPGEAELAQAGGGALSSYVALGSAAGGGADSGVVAGPGGRAKTIRVGDSLEGWLLESITRTRLIFVRDGVRHQLVVGAPAEVLMQAEKASPAASLGAVAQ
jgi:hypothetical protein